MRKLTSFLMLWLLCLSSSMQAQTTFYKPGKRLDMTNDAVAVGSYVFIYSMYVHTENETTTNDSRFIVNNGNNNATVYNIAPNAFITNNTDHIWKIASKEIVGEGDAQAVLITLQRKMGADNKYFGIGSLTNNADAQVAQKFYLRQWTKDAYHTGVTKATSQQCDDNGTTYSDITASDNVYVVSANNKAMSTSSDTYNGSGTVGTPIVFYAAETKAIDPAAVASAITISPAPSNGAWASGTAWYKIKQNNSSYWSTNAAYTTSNGYIKLSNTETPTDARAMWCVTGNADNGFSFYNLAEGTSAKFATSGTAGGAVSHVTTSPTGSEVTLFDILQFPGTTSFYIRDHGTANNFLNLRDGYLAHWDNDLGMGNDGSKIEFEAVSDENLLAAATAAKTQMLDRLTAWNNISAIDGISAIYNELNDNTATDAMGMLAAVSKAQTAFAAAVNGKRVKLTICESNTSHNRYGRVLALDATKAHGKQPGQTADEIITLKANRDATVNLYNEYYNTYVAAPGNANAATAEGAGNFYLQISSNKTSAVQNVAAFKTKANDMLHMNANGDCPLMNYNDFNDGASRWTFALINDLDFAKQELSTLLPQVTAYKEKLARSLDNLKGTYYTALATAITNAQSAIETDDAESIATAKSNLETAWSNMRSNLVAEAGVTQHFRLRSQAFERTWYLTTVNDAGDGMKVKALDRADQTQIYYFNKGADGFEIRGHAAAGGKAVTFSAWTVSLNATYGEGYQFLVTNISDDLYTIEQRNNTTDQRFFAPGDKIGAEATIYSNQSASTGRTLWAFEPLSSEEAALITAINEATATYEALSAYTRTSTDFITTPTTVLSTLNTAIEAARAALAVADGTKEYYTTAKNTLSKAVADAQKGFYAQFGDTKFRLKLKDTELYMQVNYPKSGNEGNARLAATSAANPDQCFSLIAGAGDNEGKYFIQAQGKRLQDLSWWDSDMSSTGTAFTFEPVDLAAGEVKIKGSQGYYGPSASPVAGTIIYTNKGAGDKVTWVLEPLAKNDYRIPFEADIKPIQKWHKAYYTKIKDKSSAVMRDYESAYNEANALESNLDKATSAQIVASHKALLPAYKAMTDALPEAAGQLFRLQLHSSYHGDNYFMEVINANLKGVVVTQGPRTVPARTFTFAKQVDGSYVIKCGDNPLIYSTGSNTWDVQCATGVASKWQVTPDANVANRFSIRKVGESSTYLSPDNTLKEDGSYIVYSNWATANTWELVPVADEDVTGYDEALLQRAEDLYKKYLPYKGVYNALYDAEKENLPGYPQAGSFGFDGHFSLLEEMLIKPSSITKDALDEFEAGVPYVLPVLEKYPTNRYFVIRNNSRGYMTYDTSAGSGETSDKETLTYVWSTGKDGATAFNPALANHQWCFMENPQAEGEYFLYNVGKKQYARPAKVNSNTDQHYTWVFSDEPAPVTLEWRSGHEMFVTAKSTSDPEDTKVYLSMDKDFSGPLISYTDQGLTDDGLRFTFDWATPTEVNADVTSAVTALVQNDVELTTIGETSLITGLTGEQTTIRTFSSTKAFNVPEGVTAYIATTQIEDGTTIIDLQAVPAEEAVLAQKGVLLIGNANTAKLPVNYRPAAGKFDWAANKFHSTATGGVPMTSGCYILANGEKGIGIYASSTGTLSQGKAYLKLAASETSNRLVMRFNGVETSIENLLPAVCGEQGAVYDLSGRRVNTVQKGGVYIQNGKKFIYK